MRFFRPLAGLLLLASVMLATPLQPALAANCTPSLSLTAPDNVYANILEVLRWMCAKGGDVFTVTNAMTTSNATVTTGQSIGGLQTLAGMARNSDSLGAIGTSGLIQSVLVTFKDAVASGAIDVFLFDANPSGSTCTNAAAFVLADADRGKVIGVAQITAGIAGNTAATEQYIGPPIPYGLASSTTVYACVVARASFAITGVANASLKVATLRN